MEAWLKAQALWRIVNGTSKRPSLEAENADTKPLDEWDAKSDKAAGWIWLTLEPDQKALVSSCKDSPVTMWTTLQSTYLQKKAGSRFNAYDDLFSIRKLEDETLQSLINRVDEAVKLILFEQQVHRARVGTDLVLRVYSSPGVQQSEN